MNGFLGAAKTQIPARTYNLIFHNCNIALRSMFYHVLRVFLHVHVTVTWLLPKQIVVAWDILVAILILFYVEHRSEGCNFFPILSFIPAFDNWPLGEKSAVFLGRQNSWHLWRDNLIEPRASQSLPENGSKLISFPTKQILKIKESSTYTLAVFSMNSIFISRISAVSSRLFWSLFQVILTTGISNVLRFC